MPHKYFLQQAVSDTAMDIQEAENGTETSKLQLISCQIFKEMLGFNLFSEKFSEKYF